MEITLYRKYRLPKYSIGKLYVDGKYICDTLEDTDRNLYQGMGEDWIKQKKVYAETAIPFGRYRITLKVQSPKFSKKKMYEKCKGYLPRLIDVPCWEGVLIHCGNYPKDTLGCILVGYNQIKGAVVNSTQAFWKLYDLMKAADDRGEKIYITIQK